MKNNKLNQGVVGQEKPCIHIENGKHSYISLTWRSQASGQDYHYCHYCGEVFLENSFWVKDHTNTKLRELEKIVGREFSKKEMDGMDPATAQSAKALNGLVHNIKRAIKRVRE